MTDIAGFITHSVAYSKKFISLNYIENKTEEQATQVVVQCMAMKGLVSFSILNSFFATVLVTAERYIHITRPFNYYKYINTKSVITSIVSSWLAPFTAGIASAFGSVAKQLTCTENAFTGTNGAITSLAMLVALLILILLLNILYGKILIKYWKMKRRNSMRRKHGSVPILKTHTCTNISNRQLDYPFKSQIKNVPILLSIRQLPSSEAENINGLT